MIGLPVGTAINLKLRGSSAPPPPAPKAAGEAERRRRAKVAIRLMEAGRWVTDETGYRSRNTAKAAARRLADAVSEFEEVPANHLLRVTRLQRDGWHWWVSLRAERR